jgi:uncharacterized protein
MGIRGDGLVYHTAPLTEELEIAGSIKVTLWLQIDVPDTDFMVNADEVRLDGSVVHLADTTARARYRLSRAEAHLVEPGKVLRYDFATFQLLRDALQKEAACG